MRHSLGFLLPGEKLPGAAPAAPGIIRRRSRPPLVVPASRLFSEDAEGAPGWRGRAAVVKSGTPTVGFANHATFENPFYRGEPGISAAASRFSNGTNSDGSTRYSGETAYVRLWLPGQGITAFDFAITTRITGNYTNALFYAGFRDDQPNTPAYLQPFPIERPVLATYYSKEFSVRPDGDKPEIPLRQSGGDISPSLWLAAYGSSQSGITDYFFLHHLRLYFD